MAKTTSTLDSLLSGNTSSVKEVAQVTGKDKESSKLFGVSVGIVNTIPNMPGSFLGSAFRNDIGFLKPMNYDKGLPEMKENPSVEAQIYHLSVQRQFEEYKFFESIGNQLLASEQKDITIHAKDIDMEEFPFMVKLWGETGVSFYFHNNTLKSKGVELGAEDVNKALTKLFG